MSVCCFLHSRLNGRTGMVQELQDSIDLGEFPDLEKLEVGVHTVASLLKRYFQLLPEPIIPWRHCKHFIPVMQELRVCKVNVPTAVKVICGEIGPTWLELGSREFLQEHRNF